MAQELYNKEEHIVTTTQDGSETGSGPVLSASEWDSLDEVAKVGFTAHDQIDMRRMGKKQEFRRNFKFWTSIAFTCCVMGTWEILLTSNTQALYAGGTSGLFWSMVWCYTGQTFVVLSLAEMASMAPTAGGQYHWVSEFAPRSCQKLLSYLSGWLSTISWQSIVATDCFLVGAIIQGMIVSNNVNYMPKRWQETLLIIASAIFIGIFNIAFSKRFDLVEGFFCILHFLCFLPIVVAILVLAPKTTGREVFLTFSDNGAGWPNVGWSTLVGQVSAMFAVLGSDSVAHMSEEVTEASQNVPRSMLWSFLINIIPTMVLLVSYLFCLDSVPNALNDRSGFPFIYVFRQATGSNSGTIGMTFIIFLLIVMITISSMASTSRQTFAFARDHGLPFSSWLGKVVLPPSVPQEIVSWLSGFTALTNPWTVDPRFHIPVNSIIFTCIFTILVSLINIGSTVAFNAVLSLSTVALMGTYLISISCVALKRFRGHALPPARWKLGKAGLPVNLVAITYSSWGFFWSFWPNFHDPTSQELNYAFALFVGLMGISVVVYIVFARHVYDGPVAKVRTM